MHSFWCSEFVIIQHIDNQPLSTWHDSIVETILLYEISWEDSRPCVVQSGRENAPVLSLGGACMKELPCDDEIRSEDYHLLISSGREGGMHRPLMQQIES